MQSTIPVTTLPRTSSIVIHEEVNIYYSWACQGPTIRIDKALSNALIPRP